jgi:hypothetical protein
MFFFNNKNKKEKVNDSKKLNKKIKNYNKQNYNNGKAFEDYIFNLYKSLNKSNLEKDIHIIIPSKDINLKAQIDIIYDRWFSKIYVECKYKENNSKVTLNEVSKFCAVLKLMDVPYKRGEMITNYFYDNRAIEYAKKNKLKLYDYNDIIKMEEKRKGLVDIILDKEIDIYSKIKKYN